MTDDPFAPFDTNTAGADLLLIGIVVGVMLFLFLAPVRLLRGEAEGWPQHIAGTIALGVWALILSVVVPLL